MSAYKMLCRIIKDNGNFVSKEKASEALEDISSTFDKQQKEIDKLKKCLEYYANGSNWFGNDSMYLEIDDFDIYKENGHSIGGKRARQILKELGV